MADISKITLPDNSQYDIKDAKKSGVYFVIGTQTAKTGAWTGNIDVDELYDGLTIAYYLPRDPSGNATLNLTLKDGTKTGAINCYRGQSSRLTTHYPVGSVIPMTYCSAGSITINGTATTDNRWIAIPFYDTNTTVIQTLTINDNKNTAGLNGVAQYNLIMEDSNKQYQGLVLTSGTGTTKEKNPVGFLPPNIFYCNGSNSYVKDAALTGTNIYTSYAIDLRYSTNCGTTLTNGKSTYLVGTIHNDGLFYLADTWWSQSLPTADGDQVYIYIGPAISNHQVHLATFHPMFWHKDGKVQLYAGASSYAINAGTVNGHTVESNVPTNAKFTDTTYTFDAVDGQLRVTPSSGSSYLVPLGDGNASVVYYELDFNGSSTIEQSGDVASIAEQIIQDFEDGNRKIIVGARNTIIDDLIDESETSATNVLYFDITSVSGTKSITITGSVFDGVHYINHEAINKYTLIISNTAETGITWVAMMQRNNMIVETDKAGLMDWDSYSQLMNETSRDYSYTPTYNTSNSNKVWKTDANGSPAWRKNDGVSWTLDFNGSDTATVPASMISEIRTAYSGGSVIIVRAINVTLGTVANNSRIEFHMTTIGMTGTFALIGYYVGTSPLEDHSYITHYILTITPNTISNLDGTAVIENHDLEVTNTKKGLMSAYVYRQIWNRASSTDDSDASKNTDNANKVWKCDASGTPGWRTDDNTTYNTADYNSSGLSSADMYRRIYNVDSTDGSVVSSRDWYVYMTDSNGSPGWRNNAATYNHPGLFGSSQYRQIFNRVSATDDSYNTDNANKVWKCNASGTPGWRDDDNTTYSDFTAATSSAAGTHGLVPAPASGKQASYLRGDKTWQAAANNLTTTAGGLLLDARQGKALNDKITAIEGNDHYTNSIMTNVTNATIIKFGRDTGAITNSIWNFDASGTFSSIYWAIVYVDNTSSTWVCTATAIVSSTTVRARLHQRNAMNTNQTVDSGPHVSVVVCGVAK